MADSDGNGGPVDGWGLPPGGPAASQSPEHPEPGGANRPRRVLLVWGAVGIVAVMLVGWAFVLTQQDGEGTASSVSGSATTVSTELSLRERRDARLADEAQLYGPLSDVSTSPTSGGFELVGSWAGSGRFFGGLLLVLERRGIVALDPATGDVAWVNDSCIDAHWRSTYPGTDAPVAVFVCTGSVSMAVNVADGATLWVRDFGPDIAYARTGPTMLVLSDETKRTVTAVSLQTGEPSVFDDTLAVAAPVSSESLIFVSTDNQINAIDPVSRHLRWASDEKAWSMYYEDGVLYARPGSGGVEALDADTGKRLWRHLEGPGDDGLNFSEFAGATDDAVILMTYDPDVAAGYSKHDGQQTWRLNSEAHMSVRGGTTFWTSTDYGKQAMLVHEASGLVVATYADPAEGAPADSKGQMVSYVTGEAPFQYLRVVTVD